MRKCAVAAAAIAAFGMSVAARAAVVGTDNASASAYTGGWSSASDGFVTGDAALAPWTLTANGGTGASQAAGFFIGDATANGFANINSSGSKSFGLYAHSTNADASATAYRPFGATLSVGQTFSIDLSTNFGDGNRGLDVKDSTGNNVFNLNANNQNFFATGTTSTQVSSGYNPTAIIHVALTQTTAIGGMWTVTRGADSASGAYTGVAAAMNLYMNGIGYDAGGNDFFANNVAIVPEPASVAVLGLGAAGLLRRRK